MAQAIQIRMGGYGPATTGFSKSLKFIGERLEREFGDRIEVKYVWNIMDFGYRAEDILWLVEDGLLTLGYQSSSYLTERVPELGVVDLPFLFANTLAARAAMDGTLGDLLSRKIEARANYRILGWFENGFRHISNRLRPVRRQRALAPARNVDSPFPEEGSCVLIAKLQLRNNRLRSPQRRQRPPFWPDWKRKKAGSSTGSSPIVIF